MKKITYILLGVIFITVLFTHCNTAKRTTMSVAQLDRIATFPSKSIIDTTHYTYSIPKQTPPILIDPKDNFEQSYQALKAMLQGTQTVDFERAVYLSENPYHNNQYQYTTYQKSIDAQVYFIQQLINANDQSDTMNFDVYVGSNGKFKLADMRYLPKEKKKLYKNAVANWSIFKFITDTVYAHWKLNNQDVIYYHPPFTYVTNDPFGKKDWSNTQVVNLLFSEQQKGNCFSLTAFYKILANRLGADARICTAPQHSYIQHRDNKGDYYNVELATAGFPRDGTIQTLTNTTSTAIKSGIALRDYTEQQSIGLCLVNLAKSYEHYYETKDDDFLLKCAETVLQKDSLNLSALLLKQQVLDERVTKYATQQNINNIALLKQDNKIQSDINDLEKHNALLYRLGYRQMPIDMQQIIMSGNYPENGFADKNASPFTTIKPKDVESITYKSLSGGLFQEVYDTKPTELYGHFIFDTKTKQLKKIDTKAQDNFIIDPVAFAYDFGARMYDARLGRWLSRDPLEKEYTDLGPYVGMGNSPIILKDPDGKRLYNSAGAGHDPDNTGYIGAMLKALDFYAGIKNTVDIDAHKRPIMGFPVDAVWAIGKYSQKPYYNLMTDNGVVDLEKVTMQNIDSRIKNTVEAIHKDLETKPLAANEQFNLMGYSTGAVIMAQTALVLTKEEGKQIDNLILIGSPWKKDNDLQKALESNTNIKKIIRIDIPGDNVSDGTSALPSFLSQGNDHLHFKYAFNKGVNKNRKELADFLKAQGVADYKSQAKEIVKQINAKKE